jgi:hypothetical protein
VTIGDGTIADAYIAAGTRDASMDGTNPWLITSRVAMARSVEDRWRRDVLRANLLTAVRGAARRAADLYSREWGQPSPVDMVRSNPEEIDCGGLNVIMETNYPAQPPDPVRTRRWPMHQNAAVSGPGLQSDRYSEWYRSDEWRCRALPHVGLRTVQGFA